MASLGHIAVGVAAGRMFSQTQDARLWAQQHPRQDSVGLWMLLFVGFSMLPDADVVAFSFGIPYGAPWGHRGASHSLAMACLFGVGVGLLWSALSRWQLPAWRVALWVAAVTASHGLLDTLTNGGLGAALLWPFSHARFFAPWRPLPVAPIGRGIFSDYGLFVMATELLLFTPLWIYAFWPRPKPR